MGKKNRNKVDRRRFLQLAGASIVSTGVAVGKGDSQPASSQDPPYHVSGHRTHRYVPDGDVYHHHEKFVSDELQPPYGTSVVKFDVDQVPRERIPDEYKNPDIRFEVNGEDTAVIGTRDEFATNERESVSSDVVVAATPESYVGPQYAYKNGSKLERASPINVGWYKYGGSAGGVKNKMENGFGGIGGIGNWDSPIAGLSFNRVIIAANGGLKQENAEAAKIPTGAQPFAQWHVRLWNVSTGSSNGYPVIGQVHYDVRDHGIITDPSFQFTASRNKILTAWRDYTSYSTTNMKIYNGTGFPDADSSQGKFGAIYRG